MTSAFTTSTFFPSLKATVSSVSSLKPSAPRPARDVPNMIITVPPSVPADVRRQRAKVMRERAAILADRVYDMFRESKSNGEEQTVRNLLANFTKGFRHTDDGQIADEDDYQRFVEVIVTNGLQPEVATVALGPNVDDEGNPIWRSPPARMGGENNSPVPVRGWESATAGNAFSLIGPDPQAIPMPSAPLLTSDEAIAELGELYAMAIARDIPIANWNTDPTIQKLINLLNSLPWFANPSQEVPTEAEKARRRGLFSAQTLFRGILPASVKGPYFSQFLVIGTGDDPAAGQIAFGANVVDQRVSIVQPNLDFMTDMPTFLDVQDAADLRGQDVFLEGTTFMRNLRDLSTYVHFDQLYQAYFNACLIMLSDGEQFPFDPELPFSGTDSEDRQQGFVLYGGPHILTLVAEVATRALKSVRYQKYNVHRRLRPEAAGGLVNVAKTSGKFSDVVGPICTQLSPLLELVRDHNKAQNSKDASRSNADSYLLPMAFPEGSPMHPTYGSGHATVAGGCVTILKAFFDESTEFTALYEPDAHGNVVKVNLPPGETITVGDELNKLADNISIGRDAAGVHWFSDQWESLLLGEAVAIQLLAETQVTLSEKFNFNLTKFNGDKIRIDPDGIVRNH